MESKEESKKESLSNTTQEVKASNFHKKSTSIFMTIANENMKNIDSYIQKLYDLQQLKYIIVGKHDGPKLEHYHIYAQYLSTKILILKISITVILKKLIQLKLQLDI